MDVKYDIMTDDGEHLDSFIPSKAKALRILRKFREQYPTACLVKVVRTRCPEPQLKKEQ